MQKRRRLRQGAMATHQTQGIFLLMYALDASEISIAYSGRLRDSHLDAVVTSRSPPGRSLIF